MDSDLIKLVNKLQDTFANLGKPTSTSPAFVCFSLSMNTDKQFQLLLDKAAS